MKKLIAFVLTVILAISSLVACTSSNNSGAGNTGGNQGSGSGGAPNFDSNRPISVVTREDGSGTRSAFIELFGIQDANKNDQTTREAIVADKTDVMMTTVANDPYSIGYVSLGSLNNTVKAVGVNGVAATAANVKNGSYPIQRPFIIATAGEPTGPTKDFIDFIMSKEGQAVVGARGYIAVNQGAAPYSGSKPSGNIVIGGSSSVTPLMEKLREEYLAINPNATIEIHMFDSSTGMSGTIDGTFDIGMASRELKESEAAKLTGVEIALDGIAVIVNPNNPITDISRENVKRIYIGDATIWSDIK